MQSTPKPPDSAVNDWYRWVDEITHPVILDGGLGEALMTRGHDLSSGTLWSGQLLVTNPSEVTLTSLPTVHCLFKAQLCAIGEDWLRAGSEIILTATYQVTLDALSREHGLSDRDALARITDNCNELRRSISAFTSSGNCVTRRIPRLALSLGPLSAVLADCNEYSTPYSNDITSEQFIAFHQTRAVQFKAASGADILAFETIGYEAEAIAIVKSMAHPKLQGVPFWLSLRCKDESHLAYGESLECAVAAILSACFANPSNSLVALGINCVDVAITASLVSTVSEQIRVFMNGCTCPWRIDVLAYPNNGQIWVDGGWAWSPSFGMKTPLSTADWADIVKNCGARLIGGCCRTGPDHISALSQNRGRHDINTSPEDVEISNK